MPKSSTCEYELTPAQLRTPKSSTCEHYLIPGRSASHIPFLELPSGNSRKAMHTTTGWMLLDTLCVDGTGTDTLQFEFFILRQLKR